MRRNGLILILVISLAANVTALATIGYHYYQNTCVLQSGPCPLSSNNGHLYESLGLSESQLSQVKPLARTFHGSLEEMTGEMSDKRDQLVDLLSQERVDHDRLESVRTQMAAIQGRIEREVISHLLSFKEVLTPEQQSRFFNLMRYSLDQGQGPWFSENTGG